MRQQGTVNFTALDAYKWLFGDFASFQTYLDNYRQEMIADTRTNGVIIGGAVTAIGGLQVQIAAGACFFSSGQLVTWDAQTITLAAASGANPRYSRVELQYSLANGSNVVNTLGVTVLFDKKHTATAAENEGTPAGSPVAPTRTAGAISLAVVHVATSQTVLGGGDIDQTEDTALDLSALIIGDSSHLIRMNRTKGALEVSTDGTTWFSLGVGYQASTNFAASPFTVQKYFSTIVVDTSGGGPCIQTLPSAASVVGKRFTFIKSTADGNVVRLTRSGSDTFLNNAGSTTFDLTNQWDVFTVEATALGGYVFV